MSHITSHSGGQLHKIEFNRKSHIYRYSHFNYDVNQCEKLDIYRERFADAFIDDPFVSSFVVFVMLCEQLELFI